jgi:hypothetical protein
MIQQTPVLMELKLTKKNVPVEINQKDING